MPWFPPNPYEPMPNLGGYLRGISPKMNTSEFDMVIYWQWVHACLPGTCRTPQQAWAKLGMTPAHARDAIDKAIVPLEIYPQALRRAQSEPLRRMLAGEDDSYEPMPGLGAYLRSLSPKMNTSEMDMVLYWQWVHCEPRQWQKSPTKAWNDLGMTQAHAADAIAKRIVPMEIYPEAYERANGDGSAVDRAVAAAARRGKAKKAGAGARGRSKTRR